MNADSNTQHSVPTGAADPLLSRFETNGPPFASATTTAEIFRRPQFACRALRDIPSQFFRASIAQELERLFVPQPGEWVM